MAIPDEILREIVSDPDFQKLSEQDQDRFMDRINQESFGATPKTENLLQRMGKAAREVVGPSAQFSGGLIDSAGFGLPGLAMDKMLPDSAKEYLNPQGAGEQIGRTAGNIGGFVLGGPEQLAAKGAKGLIPGAGKFLKGAAGGAAGTASLAPASMMSGDSSLEEEGLRTLGGGLLGGSLEALPNAFFKGAFRKNIKREKLESLNKDLASTKEQVKQSGKTYDATSLLDELEKIKDGMAPAVQGKATELNKWISDLRSRTQSAILSPSGKPVSKPPIMTADEVRQMESELGAHAKFGDLKGGFFQLPKPKSPIANQATKEARTAASGEYDTLAGPEFAAKSKKVSSILKKYPDLDPSKEKGDVAQRLITSLAAGGATGNPIAGLLTYALQKAASVPAAKQALYKGAKSPLAKGIAKAAGKTTQAAYGTAGR